MIPLSGFSLIVHLLIIGVAKTAQVFSAKHDGVSRHYPESNSVTKSKLKQISSLIILGLVLAFMTTTFGLAVATTLEVGKDEPQARLVNKVAYLFFDLKEKLGD